MGRLAIGVLAGLLLAASATLAHASVFEFSYLANGGPSGKEFGHGFITLSNTETDGYYDVLAIQGVANHSPITGLSDYAGADNVVHTDGTFVDPGGISFATISGVDYNFFSYGTGYEVLSSMTQPYALASNASALERLCVTYVSSAVPEPSTWLLLVVGIGGLGLACRRRERPSDAQGAQLV